jgi:hypothetical protein
VEQLRQLVMMGRYFGYFPLGDDPFFWEDMARWLALEAWAEAQVSPPPTSADDETPISLSWADI